MLGGGWYYLFPLLGVACGITLRGRAVRVATAALPLGTALVVWAGGGTLESILAFSWGTFSAGLVVAVILHLHMVIGELNQTRQRLAEAAVAEERLRFSRDLHDLLGHTLSVIVVKAEAVRRLARRDPGQAERQAADIEAVGRQALTEVREAVTGYRAGGLADELDRARTPWRRPAVGPASAARAAAARGPRRCWAGWYGRRVTNIIRHSCATEAEIDLTGLTLTIRDNGTDGAAAHQERQRHPTDPPTSDGGPVRPATRSRAAARSRPGAAAGSRSGRTARPGGRQHRGGPPPGRRLPAHRHPPLGVRRLPPDHPDGLARAGSQAYDCRCESRLPGPFEVRNRDGAVVEVPGVRLRALLAALALEPGRIVSRARLVDWIWGQRPPADEVNALQALVSRLRRVLPDGVIEADSGGYRLAVAPDAVDVCRFEHLVGQARAAEPAARADLLRSALALWRGAAMADIALQDSDAFDAAVARLDELYVAALGDRVDADIRLGRGSELVSELTELVAAYPLREGFVAALMRALAEAGRGQRGVDRVPADARAARRGAGRRSIGRALRAAHRAAPGRAGRAGGEPQDEPARRADEFRRQGR